MNTQANTKGRIKRTALSMASIIALSTGIVATPVYAQANTPREISVQAMPLDDAINAIADQSGTQIVIYSEDSEGLSAPALSGTYTAEQALDTILQDTTLEYRRINDRTIAVGPPSRFSVAEASATQPSSQSEELAVEPFRVAQVDQTEVVQEIDSDEEGRNGDIRIEDVIVVTGTNIRGIAAESSPGRTFSRDDIDATGAATAQEFIQTLSSNFSGGSNANIPGGLPNDAGAGGNTGAFGSYGSSVNLRGLGSGSTLVLLNGRRLAPASATGDFADISMIPASAIERVETLTDGASSIYGSDAVAGVVNFVLRDDFEGLEASARYGVGTEENSPSQYRASLTGGTNWENGNGLFVYEYFSQDELSVEDRSFALKTFSPSFLLPSQERHSILGSLNYYINPDLEISTDITFSERESRSIRSDISGNTFQQDANSENFNASAGLSWRFKEDWFLDLNGNFSEIQTKNQSSIFSDDLRETDSSILVGDLILSGPIYDLPAGDIRVAIGGHLREEDLKQTVTFGASGDMRTDRDGSRNVHAIYGEAFIPVISEENQLSLIERLEINLSGRWEDYSDFGDTFDPKIGILLSPLEGLNFRGSYSTSFKAPVLGRVGAVDRSASVFNTGFLNQIFGLTSPDPLLDSAVVITRSGTEANLEPETSEAFTVGFDFSNISGPHSFNTSSSYFDIDFEDQLGLTPVPGNLINFAAVNLAFTNPDAFPDGTVVFNPSAEQINSVLDSLDLPLGNPFGLDPLDAVAINNATIVRNLSRTLVRGFDFDFSYAYELDDGNLVLGLNGTHIISFERQATTSSPVVDQVDTLFNPASTKVRGNIGFQNQSVSANLFINYINDYSVDSTAASESISDWITLDASLMYSFPESVQASALKNVTLRFSAVNILDQDPPSIPFNSTLNVDGYDPTNASPLGRFVSFEVSKKF